MSVKKILQYGKYGLILGLMLVGLIFLNVAVQRQGEVEDRHKIDKSKLNVALVNEDQAIKDEDGLTYQLGTSYVKSLEKDESSNWTVTSRAAAESGLEDNRYQLMVIIPSNFSSKVLDIDSLTTNKALVTYEVNANGNHQMETAAHKLGSQIVADLNGQLVNMYMASILENLYLAQQNVLALSDVQASNIGDYTTNVYDSALGFQDDFEPMLALANSSLSANDSLLASMSERHENRFNRSSVQSNASRNPERSGTADEDRPPVASRRLSMSQEELTESLNLMLAAVRQNQQKLEQAEEGNSEALPNQVAGPEQNQADDSYKQLVDKMQEEIDRLDGEVKAIQEENERQSDLVVERLSEKIRSYYDKEKGTAISLKDFLAKSSLQLDLETQEATVQRAVDKLPALDPSQIAEHLNALGDSPVTFKYGDYAKRYYGEKYSPSDLGTRLETAKKDLESSLSQAASGQSRQVTYVYNHGGGTTEAPAPANPEADSPDEPEAEPAPTPAPEVPGEGTPPAEPATPQAEEIRPASHIRRLNQEPATTATISVSAPDFVTVTSLTVNGQSVANGGTLSLAAGPNPITVSFDYKARESKPVGPQDISITVTPSSGTKLTQTLPIDLGPYDNEGYSKAVETYASLRQEAVDSYATVDALVEASSVSKADGERVPLSTAMNQDVSGALEDLVKNSLTLAYGGSEPTGLSQLKETKSRLEANLADLKEGNESIASQLEEVLGKIEGATPEPSDDSREGDDSTSRPDREEVEDLAELEENTATLRAQSEERLSNARGVNSSFQTFQNQVERAQQNSVQLSKSADDLMNQFNDELEENGNFVEAFTKVFSNAYNDGVANEVLLDFLSRPVSERAQSVQATANVYRPFTWIILIEVLSLFTAYIFANQSGLKPIKDKYKQSLLAQSDVISVGLLVLTSILTGLVLGFVSVGQLSINQSLLPSWLFLTVVLSLILALGQYLVIKNFRVLGMGLSLLMLVSYIYVTNAVGRAVASSGSLGLVKRTNFLAFVEEVLTGLFRDNMLGLGTLLTLLALAIILTIINVFVPNFKEALRKGVIGHGVNQ